MMKCERERREREREREREERGEAHSCTDRLNVNTLEYLRNHKPASLCNAYGNISL